MSPELSVALVSGRADRDQRCAGRSGWCFDYVAAVRVYGQLAAGEDLDPVPMVVAGVALIVLTLVALLSETLLSRRR